MELQCRCKAVSGEMPVSGRVHRAPHDRQQECADVERDPTADDGSEPVRRHVVRILLRHDDQMSVSDAVAAHEETNAIETQGGARRRRRVCG
jgi:hypothetical protein